MNPRHERGVAAILLLVFMLVVAGFATTSLLSQVSTGAHDGLSGAESLRALYLAESGVEYALRRRTMAPPTACGPALTGQVAVIANQQFFRIVSATPAGGDCAVRVIGWTQAGATFPPRVTARRDITATLRTAPPAQRGIRRWVEN